MYTPRFFYTTCLCILLISIIGMFRYSSAIGESKQNIRALEEQIAMVQTEMVSMVVPVPDSIDSAQEEVTKPEPVVEESLEPIEAEELPVPAAAPIVDTSLPAQVHLSVPFTSQAPEKNWDQPWQDACEEAAILMLDAYYKGYNLSPLFARDELLKLVAWEAEQGWGGSIDIVDVRSLAAWYMKGTEDQFRMLRYPTVAEIKAELAAERPVLAVADGTALPNPHFSGDGPPYHALLIIGYNDATSEFITNDPGTQHGKNFRYKYDDLVNSLRDWNGGDVKNGMPVVLVKQ